MLKILQVALAEADSVEMDALVVGAIVILVGAGAVVGMVLGRIWPLLLLLPPVFGGLAWYGWEFYGPAGIYAVGITVVGYVGLAVGLALRGPCRRVRRWLGWVEL